MGCRVAGSERWRESEGERGEEGRRRMEIVTRLWMRASMKPMVCETPRERNEGEGDTAVAPTAEIAHARTRSKRRGKRKKKKEKERKKGKKGEGRGRKERKRERRLVCRYRNQWVRRISTTAPALFSRGSNQLPFLSLSFSLRNGGRSAGRPSLSIWNIGFWRNGTTDRPVIRGSIPSSHGVDLFCLFIY